MVGQGCFVPALRFWFNATFIVSKPMFLRQMIACTALRLTEPERLSTIYQCLTSPVHGQRNTVVCVECVCQFASDLLSWHSVLLAGNKQHGK